MVKRAKYAAIWLTVLTLSLYAGKIPGMSYRDFLNISHEKKIDRPILLMVLDPKCPYCKKEMQALSSDKNFTEMAKTKYLVVYADKNDPDLPPPFSTTDIVPSFFILTPSMKFIAYPAKGAIPPKTLDEWLIKVYDAYMDIAKKENGSNQKKEVK